MPFIDDVNRLLRDHEGYTGDGQGGVGPLPVGDRSTARRAVWKRDLRELLITLAQTMGDPSALQDILDELDGKADLANSGRFFTSRAAAVSIGQSALPGTLGLIMTVEDGWLAVRSFSNASDDPLFETQPSWGVALRAPNAATLAGALNVASVIPLINIGGTGNAITADLAVNAVAAGASVTASTSVRYVPAATNSNDTETDVTLFVTGDEPRIVRTEDGMRLPAGYFVAGRAYTLDRRGTIWRVSSGGVSRAELTAKAGANTVANALNISGVIPLSNVAGSANEITADLAPNAVLAGVSVVLGTTVMLIPASTNTGPVTLFVAGDQVRGVYDPDGQPLPAGYFKPGRGHTLTRYDGGAWRVLGGTVDPKDMTAVLGGKADLENSGKIFTSRGDAVAAGQSKLPASLRSIITMNGPWMYIRTPASTDDQLFSTAPYWGIHQVHNMTWPIVNGAIPRLNTASVASGPYQASFPASESRWLRGGDLTPKSKVEFIPNRNSPANPSIIIDGDIERSILSSTGAPLPAGAMRAQKSYILNRRGDAWRLMFDDQVAVPDDLVERLGALETGLTAEAQSRAAGDQAESAARQVAVAALQDDVNDLRTDVDALVSGTRVVGDWDASSGAFPTARPDAAPVQAGDQWTVAGGGAVDGIAFAPGDLLIALVDGGGAAYAGTWSRRIGTATQADQVSTSEIGVTVQGWLDYAGRLYTSRGAVISSSVPAPVQVLQWQDDALVLEVARTTDPSAACLATNGGAVMWAPKGRPTPLHFGAIGDGQTDDTVAVQAWIDFLRAFSCNGWLPGGYAFRVSAIDAHPTAPYSITGDGERASVIVIMNPDRAGIGFNLSHPATPSTRGSAVVLRSFGIEVAAGNKAKAMSHRYSSDLKMRQIRFGRQPGNAAEVQVTMLEIEKPWNVDISEISLWSGGVNFPAHVIPETLRFTISAGSDVLSTSDGSNFFTGDMVGDFITLSTNSASIPQCFRVINFFDATQVQVDVVAQRPFTAAPGFFGGVRGSMEAGSNILTIQRAALTADDVGRKVYVHGAYLQDGRAWPLPARVTAVNGTEIVLDAVATLDVEMTELVFDPAVDFGDYDYSTSQKANDFKFRDLHVERHQGTGLVVTGVGASGSDVKLHGNPPEESVIRSTNIQMYAYDWYGHIDGGFEQQVGGNRKGRILMTAMDAATSLGYFETIAIHDAPTVCLDLCAAGAMVDITGIKAKGSGASTRLLRGVTKVIGDGLIRCGFVSAKDVPAIHSIGYSMGAYTVSTLPDPSSELGPIIVMDAPGPVMAFSNGTSWLRCSDLGVIA